MFFILFISGLFISQPDTGFAGTHAPSVVGVYAVSDCILTILFDKPLDIDNLKSENFNIKHNITRDVFANNNMKLIITFQHEFRNNVEYDLYLEGIRGIDGNYVDTSTVGFIFYLPERHDVVISEVMFDPYPAVLLPETEYFELYNCTPHNISLEGWKISVNDNNKLLPDCILKSREYIILADYRSFSELSPYGKVVKMDFLPALPNAGARISLYDRKGSIINTFTYSPMLFIEGYKKDGGWSLEIIDPENPCIIDGNYRGSIDYNGGTPGTPNSVFSKNPDYIAPYMERAALISDSVLRVFFSEPMDSIKLVEPGSFAVEPDAGNLDKVIPRLPDFRCADLCFTSAFIKSIIYNIRCTGQVTDCSGNVLQQSRDIKFARATPADSFELIINEILFDPAEQGSAFVELYNRSNRVIDIKDHYLASKDPFTGSIKQMYRISSENMLVFPGDYLCLSEDKDLIRSVFPEAPLHFIYEMDKTPYFTNNNGCVCVLNNEQDILDEFCYSSSMHFSLLGSTKGVSLERIYPDVPANNYGNWHSAAEQSGFATPGYKNSQYSEPTECNSNIILEPRVISPDNDGYNDVLTIKYSFDSPGYTGTFCVFDANGNLIRTLARSKLLGTEGFILWDGLDRNNNKTSMGIYLITANVFRPDGTVYSSKHTCVVAPGR